MKDNYNIGEKIKKYRITMGFSQEELSFRANISTVYLRQIEKGKKNPTVMTIIKLCNGLSIHPADLFEPNETPLLSSTDQQIIAFLSNKTENEKILALNLLKIAFELKKFNNEQ